MKANHHTESFRKDGQTLFEGAETHTFRDAMEVDDSAAKAEKIVLTEEEQALLDKLSGEKRALLAQLHTICQKLNLSYFAVGNLLQAVLFFDETPEPDWNNSWSIALLRPDCDALLNYLRQGQEPALCVLDAEPENKMPLEIPLICAVPLARENGVLSGIRIIPVDVLPSDEEERHRFWMETARATVRFRRAYEKGQLEKAYQAKDRMIQLAEKYKDLSKPCFFGQVIGGNSLPAAKNQLLPGVAKNFAGIQVVCPAEPTVYVSAPSSNANDGLLAALDQFTAGIQTEILHYLDTVCVENQLRYFAFSKLLAGCVHYQNAVPGEAGDPWDIGLPRDDYEKALRILRKRAALDGYLLDTRIESSSFNSTLVTLCKEATFTYHGVSVKRLFCLYLSPFDQVPESYDWFCGFVRRMRRMNRRYNRLIALKNRPQSDTLLAASPVDWIRYLLCSPKRAFVRLQKQAAKFRGRADATNWSRMVPRRSKLISDAQLFPLERRPFADLMLPGPADISCWTSVMDDALKTQIESIQKADLTMLSAFDAICQKLHIGYFICGGSMLGYVRHGGFIPWDDDIDVGLLRADYDRFCAEGAKLLDDRFFFQTRETDPKIPYMFSKIRMNNTEYVTKYNELRPFHKGICLDLFPFDAIPDDPEELDEFLYRIGKRVKRHNRWANKGEAEPVNQPKIGGAEDLIFRIMGKAHRAAFRMLPLTVSQNAYLKEATKYNAVAAERGLSSVASFIPSYTYIRKEDLLPYQRGSFSGVETSVPNRPEVFLTMQYGDFMSLPPLYLQTGHPLIRWSVDVTGDQAKAAGYPQNEEQNQ